MNSDNNPWSVKNFDEFLYYCCPECDERNQSKELFIKHAIDKHPDSQEYIFEIKKEPSNDITKAVDDLNDDKTDLQAITEIHDDNFDSFEPHIKVEEDYESYVKYEEYFEPFDEEGDDFTEEANSNTKKPKKNAKKAKVLKCDFCPETFTKTSRLQAHAKEVHGVTKIHKCEQCNKVFSQKSTLITHIGYAHEGANKNHICAQCGKAFSTNSNLHKHHRNVHEKRKNNVCNFCSKAFGESSDLKKHIEWVHEGVKDKICDLCGMAFGHGHALKRHLRTVHEGIKDHVCNVCSKVRQQNGLFYETLLIMLNNSIFCPFIGIYVFLRPQGTYHQCTQGDQESQM